MIKRYAFYVELLAVAIARSSRITKMPAPGRIKLTSRFKVRK